MYSYPKKLWRKIDLDSNKQRRNSDTALLASIANFSDNNIKNKNNIPSNNKELSKLISNKKETLSDLKIESTTSFNNLPQSNSFLIDDSTDGINKRHSVVVDFSTNSMNTNDNFLKVNDKFLPKRHSFCVFKSISISSQDLNDNLESLSASASSNLLSGNDSFYGNDRKTENTLQVPQLDLQPRVSIRLKSNIPTRKNNLAERKDSGRRYKSAPNTRRNQITSTIYSTFPQEKNFLSKPIVNYCKNCEKKKADRKHCFQYIK
ncbi:unnamed protein product [Brachionus calyciflorus]|uniref:Uncharacterized protein n=1 Tax=Brachionus calyciflorus TaxID=104777 RepID=A0A813SDG2_9BILA|nr:unnamed protein product [Brachionus calyciflorus]